MAAAISRMRSLPVGSRRTMTIKTTANSTAARPPATPNRTRFGSTNPPRLTSPNKKARSERVYEPSTEHAAAPPHHDPAEHHQAWHQDAGDEDQSALVLLRERQRKSAARLRRDGDQGVLLGQPLERRECQLEVEVAVVGGQGPVLRKAGRPDDHDPGSLRAGRLLERRHDGERSSGISRLAAQVLH